MSRINTNVQSLIAQHVVARQNSDLNTSLQRLSTGLRVNSGKDDPAGLIASETLRAQKAGISQAISNGERANSVIGTADSALSEINSLLTELQGLVTETASTGGMTTEQISANQQQVDAILNSINRIVNSTTFGGKKLLDGTMAYTTSGASTTNLASVQINSARVPTGSNKSVMISVTTSAQFAQLKYAASGTPNQVLSLEIAGTKGAEVLNFAASTHVSAIAVAVNALKAATGVSATLSGPNGAIYFNSQGYGEDAFVSVTALQGAFALQGGVTRDEGRDPVVKINGATASVDGVKASLRNSDLDIDLVLKNGFASTLGSTTFHITGGGADFLLGAEVNLNNKASIGINSISTSSLGNSGTGFLSTLGSGQNNALTGSNTATAQTIVSEAISQVATLRGRLGAFQAYTVSPMINSLQVVLENVSAADSAIRDTDFAAETSNLTRSQILSNAAMNVLAMANSAPQSVLSLLRG